MSDYIEVFLLMVAILFSSVAVLLAGSSLVDKGKMSNMQYQIMARIVYMMLGVILGVGLMLWWPK